VAEARSFASECKRDWWKAVHANLGELRASMAQSMTSTSFTTAPDFLSEQNMSARFIFPLRRAAPFRAMQGLGTPGIYFGAENLLSARFSCQGRHVL
jgi:hypothetical protein